MCALEHNDTTVKMRMSVISVTLAIESKPGQLFAAGAVWIALTKAPLASLRKIDAER